LRTRIKLEKLTDDDGDVYYGREFDNVGICVIGPADYMLLKLKEKNRWHFVMAILAFALR